MSSVGLSKSVFFASSVVAALALAGCSSTTTGTNGGTGGTEQDKGVTGDGVGIPSSGRETNPDGKAYPTTNIGTKPSSHNASTGKVGNPGNVMKNFKFYGYPNGDKSQGLQQVALADFYDPDAKNFRLIHIQAAAVWCGPCNQEAKAAASIAAELKTKKVVWLAALVETSKQGSPSTQADLDKWLGAYPSDFTHVLDPSNLNLGVFFDAAAIPWNADLDARTMEILAGGTGGAGTAEGVRSELDQWLKFLDTYTPAK
jgi:hypothetical protein